MKHAICKFSIVNFLILGLIASPAPAEQAVNETREARPDARITLNAVTGEYRIVGTDDSRLEITGTLGEDVEELVIEGDAEAWDVEVKAKQSHGRNRWSASRLTINVPRGAALDVSTVSADTELQALEGAWTRVDSVSGGVETNNVRPERLALESVSGTLSLDAGGRSENRLKTVSGNIRAQGLSGRIQAGTVSGNIDVTATSVEDAKMETVSGKVETKLEPLEQATLQFSSHSGDLRLNLPENTPLDFRANTFSGRIRNDFGGEIEESRGPGRRMELRRGAGSVRIEAESFSGSIDLEGY